MKVIIRASAFADLEGIFNWIARDSPANARRVADRISAAVTDTIVPFPHMGRAGTRRGTREWVVSGLPYIIVYAVDETRDALTVLNIFHAQQNR